MKSWSAYRFNACKARNPPRWTELEIDVKDLPKGIYNVKILNNNFSISRKLIVQ